MTRAGDTGPQVVTTSTSLDDGTTPRLTRRERRHRATREEILEVARELLLEGGPDELTLRQVARRADFSPAALYTYFSSRNELIASLFEESFRRLHASLRRIPGDLPPDRLVVELGVAYMDFARENPADLRCILSATPENLPAVGDRSLGLEVARVIGQTFRQGMDQGVFAVSDGLTPAEMAYGVWALVHGMVSLSGMDLSEVSDDICASPRRVLEAYVSGLMSRKRPIPDNT